MQGIKEFIIEIGEAFNNKLKHGSLELYVDHRTRQQEQSNRKGIVVSVPLRGKTEVEKGAEVIIDPTVLFKQTYQDNMQDSIYLVDKEKGWYRLTPEMVLLYKNPKDRDWNGHKNNLFVEPLKLEEKKTESGLLLTSPENKKEGMARVVFGNKILAHQENVFPGDVVYYDKRMKWKFNIDGKEYLYLQNNFLLGKEVA